MNRGSTPSRSPVSKIRRSMASLPEEGMSAGISLTRSRWTGYATTSGASTRLNRTPVRLVKRKIESIAKGAYFRERDKGNFRANFIRLLLHANDDHKGTLLLAGRRLL